MKSQEYLKNVSMCKNSVMEEQISENMCQETDEKEDTNPEQIMLEKGKNDIIEKIVIVLVSAVAGVIVDELCRARRYV